MTNMQPKPKRNIKVIYGSVDDTVFGATPPPPPPLQQGSSPIIQIPSIHNSMNNSLNSYHPNIHLSNLPKVQRTQSDPYFRRKGSTSPLNKLRGLYNATAHSPYFRAISPQVTARSMLVRRRESDLSETSSLKQYKFPSPTQSDEEGLSKRFEHMVDEKNLMSVWGAGFSIINLFLGLGLLSFPYALAEGGLISLAILAFICIAMSYTGKLIVRCFDEVPIDERTYPQVGYRALSKLFERISSISRHSIDESRSVTASELSAGQKQTDAVSKWGTFGYGFVIFGIAMEFLGALIMSTIFIWDNVSYLVPDLMNWEVVVICTAVILPTCWMLNFSELSFNSFLGCVCKIFTVTVIVLTFFLNTSVTKTREYDVTPRSATNFSVCVGIFILSYAGHACLPSIYTSMKEPKRFENVLDICFVIMFVTYAGMALFGYLQFGSTTQVIITANLIGETSGYQMVIAKTLIGLVIASCYFQVSPILSVAAEIPEVFYNITTPWKQRVFRTTLFLALVIVSWFVVPHLAILEAVTGSLCTMITSVICPALFYYGLNRKSVSWIETIVLFTYMFCGVVFGLFLLFNDIIAVVNGEQ